MPFQRPSSPPAPHNPFRQAPLLSVAVAMIVGIAAAWLVRGRIGSGIFLIASLCLTLCTILLFRFFKGKGKPRLAVGCALLLVTMACATNATWQYEKCNVPWMGDPRTYRASICGVQKVSEKHILLDAKLLRAPKPFDGKKVRLSLEGEKGKSLAAGDEILFYAKLRRPTRPRNPGDFNYADFLLVHGISGTAYVSDGAWQRVEPTRSPSFSAQLLHFRERLTQQYAQYLQGEKLAILSALTLGQKAELDSATRELFSDTGTSHILALSGLHLTILFSLFSSVIQRYGGRRRSFYVANVASLVGVWLFVFLAGMPLSLQRAAWMLTMYQIGSCFERSGAATLNNLAFAACALLLFQPLALMDVGFQMSFAAVLGILLGGTFVWQRFPLPYYIETPHTILQTLPLRKRILEQLAKRSYRFFQIVIVPFVTVSVSAQLATTPFVIYYFHNFPPYFLLANALVIPAAYCLLTGALCFFLIPVSQVQALIAFCLGKILGFMLSGLEAISQLPYASLSLYPTLFTLTAIVAGFFVVLRFFYVKSSRRKRRLALLLCLLLAGSMASEIYRLRPTRLRPQVIVYYVPRTTVIHFVSSAKHSWLYSSVPADTTTERMRYIQQNFFAPLHLAPPHSLTANTGNEEEMFWRGTFFKHRHTRLFVLNHNLNTTPAARPYPVDILLISHGCRDSLLTVCRTFKPRQIVLDTTLPSYLQTRWEKECRAARLPLHNIRSDGAFIWRE